MEVLDHYLYTKEHEWVNIEDDKAMVGITDYAQSALGDITFVELPELDSDVEQFEQFSSLESVKAANDIYCPMAGKIIDINRELESDPGLINKDCFEKGWIVKIKVSADNEKSKLMNAGEYRRYLETLA